MAKIPRIKPERELCKRCREWVTQKDVGRNDIPHCVNEGKFEAWEYLIGMKDNCGLFNEW